MKTFLKFLLLLGTMFSVLLFLGTLTAAIESSQYEWAAVSFIIMIILLIMCGYFLTEKDVMYLSGAEWIEKHLRP